jgi:hypothetical protein
LRFCRADGTLEFAGKMNYNTAPNSFKAWFLHENRLLADTDIFFGHWSTLSNITQPHVYPMDKGAVLIVNNINQEIESIAKKIQNSEDSPNGVNVNFVMVVVIYICKTQIHVQSLIDVYSSNRRPILKYMAVFHFLKSRSNDVTLKGEPLPKFFCRRGLQ